MNNQATDFTPDGTKLLLRSDSGREFMALSLYDIASGSRSPVYAPNWDVLGAGYSKGGKYLVVGVDEDSRVTQHVFDAATLAPVTLVGMPTGALTGMSIARNDSSFAFYESDGSSPENLYAGAFGTAPTRLTNTLNPKMRAQDLVMPSVVRFKSYDSLEVPGVLYRPHQASPIGRDAGDGARSWRARRTGDGAVFADGAGVGQSRLHGVRHQQPWQLGVRQIVQPDG